MLAEDPKCTHRSNTMPSLETRTFASFVLFPTAFSRNSVYLRIYTSRQHCDAPVCREKESQGKVQAVFHLAPTCRCFVRNSNVRSSSFLRSSITTQSPLIVYRSPLSRFRLSRCRSKEKKGGKKEAYIVCVTVVILVN